MKSIRKTLKTKDFENGQFNRHNNTFLESMYSISTDKKLNYSPRKIDNLFNQGARGITVFIRDFKKNMDRKDLELSDTIYKYLDEDKFYLWICFSLLNDVMFEKDEINDNFINSKEFKCFSEFIINYYEKILKNVNLLNCTIVLPNKQDGRLYTGKDFAEDYRKFYQEYLFSGYKVDNDLVKKMTNNPPKSLFLGWEILPNGHSIKFDRKYNKSQVNTMGGLKTSKKELDASEIAKLEDRIKFYNSLTPIMIVKGMNKMEGYFAYIFANGKVIFDKLHNIYDASSKKSDAIYCMDIKNFIYLSKFSKTEVINMIRDNLVNARRIYHTDSYKRRILDVINSDTNITKDDFDNMYNDFESNKIKSLS